jgi:hypothetical protein
MAVDSEAGHNSVDPIGEIKITFNNKGGLSLETKGVMTEPAFLEMAHGYLRQYINRRWDEAWRKEDK